MQKLSVDNEHTNVLNRIWIWKKVIFHTVGPFHPGDGENHFVFCLSDPVSGWSEFMPAKEKSVQEVTDFLVDVFLRFGVCTCELSGWATAYVEAIIKSVANKWKSLLFDVTDHNWEQFWTDMIQRGCMDSCSSDLAKKINVTLSGDAESSWELKLDRLRLSLRWQSESFSVMFGRDFMPLCPLPDLKVATPARKPRGRPRLTEQDRLEIKKRKTIEQVANILATNVVGQRYALRPVLKPKGKSKAVRTLLSKATENRQPKQLEGEESLPNDPTCKIEPNEDTNEQQLHSLCNDPSATTDKDDPESAMSEEWSDSDSSERKERKKSPKKLRKLNDSMPIKCPKCVATYVSSEKELDVHLDCHIEGSKFFRCKLCPKLSNSWAHMQRHLMFHPEISPLMTFNIPARRTCPECQKLFRTRDGMLRHVSIVHRGQKKFGCKTCRKRFKERKTYQRHLDLHANITHKCKHCTYETKIRQNFVTHSRIHNGQGHRCEICSKIFVKPSVLKSHMEIHEKERQTVACELCGLECMGKASLTSHVRNMHMERESFPCTVCSYVAKGQHNLVRHNARAHNHAFKCTQCDYSTHSDSALQKHMSVCHDEVERPYGCTKCPYRAKDTKSLQDHARLRHNPNITQFFCPHCGRAFKTQTSLRHHMPSHTGQHLYSCKICSYTAKYRQTAHHHVRTKHPGESTADTVKGLSAEEIDMLHGSEHNYSMSARVDETDLAVNSLQDGLVIASTENEIILNADLLASQPSGSFTLPNNVEMQIMEQMTFVDGDQRNISFQSIQPKNEEEM